MTAAPLALNLALASAGILGFRHGFDYDHVAAISDLASTQDQPRQGMRLGLLYALGHAATVAALGMALIVFQLSLPSGIDHWMERLVGLTLLVLGVYVLWTMVVRPRPAGHTHVPKTRIMLLLNGVLWCEWRVRQAFSSRPVRRRELFAGGIGTAPAFLVGVIHGLGAETPTQLLLLLLAANLGGIGKGMLGLAAFIAGMLLMNTVLCGMAAGLIKVASRRRIAFQAVAALSAAYSILVGAVFLAGTASVTAMLGQFAR